VRPATEAEKATPCKCCFRKSDKPQYPIKDGSRCHLYWCTGCATWQPWCCGAADDHPELCDDCVAAKDAA